eukprot:GHVT01094785.1.p2 GENE.GHVT01094785.1~~GHVT01094785.1.p2  ORF type:complete len:237 (-),score=69.82 GHVT01094785.1:405-1115(-)
MALDDREAQHQIEQMVSFILNEAKDKAAEIEAKALEEFNIEKLKMVQMMKDRIRQEYMKKIKQIEVKRSIARSTAINKARLKKITSRDEKYKASWGLACVELHKTTTADPANYKELCTKLIVQGLLRLMEKEVYVRCRRMDDGVIQEIIPAAARLYREVLQRECGVDRTVVLKLDPSPERLCPPPAPDNAGLSCCGGVVLYTPDYRISCDNTLDARIKRVAEDCAPSIRNILFVDK